MSNVEIFDTTFAMTILVIMALLLRVLLTNAVWLTFPVRPTNAIR